MQQRRSVFPFASLSRTASVLMTNICATRYLPTRKLLGQLSTEGNSFPPDKAKLCLVLSLYVSRVINSYTPPSNSPPNCTPNDTQFDTFVTIFFLKKVYLKESGFYVVISPNHPALDFFLHSRLCLYSPRFNATRWNIAVFPKTAVFCEITSRRWFLKGPREFYCQSLATPTTANAIERQEVFWLSKEARTLPRFWSIVLSFITSRFHLIFSTVTMQTFVHTSGYTLTIWKHMRWHSRVSYFLTISRTTVLPF